MSVIRIAAAGLGRERIASRALEQGGDALDVRLMSDIDAVRALQLGDIEYYLGACLSGAGGALALATALLGPTQAIRVSGLGEAPDPTRIADAVARGYRAFGMANAHIDVVVPVLIRAILDSATIDDVASPSGR